MLARMEASGILLIAAGFGLWALAHSLTASRRVKQWVQQRFGARLYDGFYRLAYNAVSVITIAPLLYLLLTRAPATVLWRVRAPWSLLLLAVQAVGLAGLALSLWQTDVWHFLGLRQALRYLQGEAQPDAPAPFVRTGAYGLVRHPLYFFSMLVLWFTPLMTAATLLFNLLASLYFWIGSLHEERRLQREFGAAYGQYRREVPAFLPRFRRQT